MTLLRVYIALSVDGYIADAEGGIRWLDDYFIPELGFREFASCIGAMVLGRKTFDQAMERGDWPYSGSPTFVLTHRPLVDAPKGVEAFGGDVRELAERLKRELAPSGKDVWLMGGGDSLRAFADADLVDRWELYTIPILLGAGVPLFPRRDPRNVKLKMTRSKTFSNGIVETWYEK